MLGSLFALPDSAPVRPEDLQSRCLKLLSNSDLEWLLEHLLADLSELAFAQSAIVWLSDERGGLSLRAYRGLWERDALAERVELHQVLSTRLLEGAPWMEGEGAQRALCLPLSTAGEVLGVVQLSDPLRGGFPEERIGDLKVLVDFAALGIKHARKMSALQRLGLRDRETSAYNLSYFTDYASKEIYKARRYARTFSLLVLSFDNLSEVQQSEGGEVAAMALRSGIRSLLNMVRDSDIIAKASEHEFYVMLPETDYFGALMFARRAAQAVRSEPQLKLLEERLPVGLTFGASTFPKDGDDFDVLVQTCRRRMEERRASLKRRLLLETASFWEEVDLLLDGPRPWRDEGGEPSRWGPFPDGLFLEVQQEIAQEVQRDPTARGVVFVGAPEVRAELPLVQALEGPPLDLAARLYVLGRRADLSGHRLLTPVFVEGDERISRHTFVLWLSEHAAYGLIQRTGEGPSAGFHTADAALVEDLIAKLQAEYDLQPY